MEAEGEGETDDLISAWYLQWDSQALVVDVFGFVICLRSCKYLRCYTPPPNAAVDSVSPERLQKKNGAKSSAGSHPLAGLWTNKPRHTRELLCTPHRSRRPSLEQPQHCCETARACLPLLPCLSNAAAPRFTYTRKGAGKARIGAGPLRS